MTKKNNKKTCVLDFAFQRIGGKYKGRILIALHRNKVLRYGELNRELSDVSLKMLTQALKELESDKLIYRKLYPEVPPKVEYTLSETGAEFIPFLEHLGAWGYKQQEKEEEKK